MIRGVIRLVVKVLSILMILSALVIYHNSDAGKAMERKIGEELRFESLKRRLATLQARVTDFLSMKGMDAAEKSGKMGAAKNVTAPPERTVKKVRETIGDDDRKMLEHVIETAP